MADYSKDIEWYVWQAQNGPNHAQGDNAAMASMYIMLQMLEEGKPRETLDLPR